MSEQAKSFSENATAFVAANRLSPVVEGVAIGRGGAGAIYRLHNGKTFELQATPGKPNETDTTDQKETG